LPQKPICNWDYDGTEQDCQPKLSEAGQRRAN